MIAPLLLFLAVVSIAVLVIVESLGKRESGYLKSRFGSCIRGRHHPVERGSGTESDNRRTCSSGNGIRLCSVETGPAQVRRHLDVHSRGREP